MKRNQSVVAAGLIGMAVSIVALSTPSVLAQAPAAAAGSRVLDPDGFWTALPGIPDDVAALPAFIRPDTYLPLQIDVAAVTARLLTAPMEFTPAGKAAPLALDIPDPSGRLQRFLLVESPVMAPELAAQFPEMKTYDGVGVDDPYAHIRLDVTDLGFRAQINTPAGRWYIDPFSRGNTSIYTSYRLENLQNQHHFTCKVIDLEQGDIKNAQFHAEMPAKQAQAAQSSTQGRIAISPPPASSSSSASNHPLVSGPTLRTYRTAIACTGEYAAFFGGTVPLAQSAIVTALNRVNGVYRQELAINMVLVANNSSVVYTNSATDPYTNGNGSTMLSQNQTTMTSVIGTANYDFGHVFSTGGGGISGLGVICKSTSKAQSVTGSPTPTGDGYWIDYVAHEMGHAFGGNHTFNSQTSNCGGGNRNASTAYELGSGITIMAYAGICGADDLDPHSIAYFHWKSIDEIVAYTNTGTGNGCAVQSATGNSMPSVSAGSAYTIPKGTPYTLTGSATDPNGDPLTYSWEEKDLGAAQTVAAADNGTSPMVWPIAPLTVPSRTIPNMTIVLNNANVDPKKFEKLPASASRVALKWRMTARDNLNVGGGSNWADVTLTVVPAAGPFAVTAPNTAVSLTGSTTVTWSVAGTDAAPINTASVNILLSTDGGATFPTTLASGVPNNGSALVTLPAINTTTARIMVAAVGNIYFDVSDTNFTITMPVITCKPSVVTGSTCLGSPDLLSYLTLYFTDYDGSGSGVPASGSLPVPFASGGLYAVPCDAAHQSAVPPVVLAEGLKGDYDADCQIASPDLLGFLADYFNPDVSCFSGC